jgi:hypothetical protein
VTAKQLRISALVSPKEKKAAERLAKNLTDGNVGKLLRDLLIERHERYMKEKKLASATKKAPNAAKLVRRKHALSLKPSGKRSPGHTAAKSTKGRSGKRGIATNSSRKGTRTTAKNR